MKNDSFASTRRWLLKHHQKLLFMLVGVGFLYSLGTHGWTLYSSYLTEEQDMRMPVAPRPAASSQQPKLALANFPLLFGSAQNKKPSLNSSEIPTTSLRLTLRGAIAGGELGSAIIQGSDGQDRLYLVGDTIPGGSVLESVHPQYVVIKHQGSLQRLSFPQLGNQKAIPDAKSSQSSQPIQLPRGPIAEAKEIEQKLDQMQQRTNRTGSGKGN